MYVIQKYKSIFLLKSLNSINILYIGSHKRNKFCIIRKNVLRRILTYFYRAKYNEINIRHSCLQDYFSTENGIDTTSDSYT